jgi:AcrR family transcriptional regulator
VPRTDDTSVPARPRLRMSADARREQLLDTAAQLLVEDGFDALTMEAVSQRAGASKTLGYVYFDNIDDVISSLAIRELGGSDARIRDAVEAVPATAPFAERIGAGVGAYLLEMVERGALLNAINAGIQSGRLSVPTTQEPLFDYLAALIEREFRFGKRRSFVYAGILGAAAFGHATLVLGGRFSLETAKAECVEFFLGGLAARTSG